VFAGLVGVVALFLGSSCRRYADQYPRSGPPRVMMMFDGVMVLVVYVVTHPGDTDGLRTLRAFGAVIAPTIRIVLSIAIARHSG